MAEHHSIFMPLTKVDATQRMIWLTMTAEKPDKAREIMDYESGKPQIQKWSDSIADASGGASLGNVRLMHGKTAIGKLTELTYDDDGKRVECCVKVVDDAAWKLVDEGVLTGGSIGGGYLKKWRDPRDNGLTRYTPLLTEFSLVDSPCLPDATFQLVKADGGTEERRFAERVWLFEPASDDVKARADDLAKAAAKPDRRNDFVVQAREALIREHTEALEKTDLGQAQRAAAQAESLEQIKALHPELDEAGLAKATEFCATMGADPGEAGAAMRKAAIEAWTPPVAEPVQPDAEAEFAAALAKAQAATSDPEPESVAEGPFADLNKAGQAVLAIVTAGRKDDPLAKGLYDVQWLAELMSCFASLQSCISSEAEWEGDGSSLPAKAKEVLTQMGQLLVQMAQEEVAEVVAQAPDVEVAEVMVMELAAQITDLVKADAPLMEKIGARNSGADTARIQAIHDHALDLGAACDTEAAEKLAKAEAGEAELVRLRRTLAASVPQIEAMAKSLGETKTELAKVQAEVAVLRKGPAPAKGVVMAISKEQDDGRAGPARPANGAAPADPADRRQWGIDLLAKNGLLPAPGG